MNPDGSPNYPAVAIPAPIGVVGTQGAYRNASPSAPVLPGASPPSALQARLYPANDIATQTGMLVGTVTNLKNGRGRFELEYRGDLLVGEATRVSNVEKSGVANAYGRNGTYMTCAYKMSTPYQGAGTCKLSNGALYQVHVGS